MATNCLRPTGTWATTNHPDIDSVESALKALRFGHPILVLDDGSEDTQGYMMCAAQLVTPKVVALITHWAKGPLGLAVEGKWCLQSLTDR
ncbi:MAG: 3,4-dihydroxy-2-butanone-4-phosphate synthase [Cyanobacteria bacterium J06597_16]